MPVPASGHPLIIPAPRHVPPSAARDDKLYLLTRADLSPGQQATQIAHAVADFCTSHHESATRWRSTSDSLILLTVPDEPSLHALAEKAVSKDVEVVTVREPDLLDSLTAICLPPGPATRKLCANLPLLGRTAPDAADVEAAQARERRMRTLAEAMTSCEQTKGQDVLAHGSSVREHLFALLDHLAGRVDLAETANWRLPSWLDVYGAEMLADVAPRHLLDRYTTLHDCGKPFVRTVDADGRAHFPDHANASTATYLDLVNADALSPTQKQAHGLVATLIATDMDVHTIGGDQVGELAARETAASSLLTGLAEITSNAAMFGGVDSTSYKIKFKQLERRGKAICVARYGPR